MTHKPLARQLTAQFYRGNLPMFALAVFAALTGGTRIVVTHTLEQAALRRYDGILVLKDGRIAETGSFDELMARKGYFYALYTVSQ